MRPPATALVATVAGTVATAVGTGVGIRYATKTGVTTTSLAGLACLVIGIALLAFAVRATWRAARRWQRLGLALAAPVGLFVVVSLTLGVAYSAAPRNQLGAATPASRGLAYDHVSFSTADHVRLDGWLLPSRNGAVVVMVPGAGSTRAAVLDQTRALNQRGYGVLMVDPRGQGGSAGRAMDLGWYGDRDLAAAVGFLRTQRNIAPDRIALLGLSMGGEEAIGAAAGLGVRAVVAEGATGRTDADKAGWLPGGVAGAIQRAMDRVSYGVVDLLTSAPRPRSLRTAVVQATHTSFLLVTAGKVRDEQSAARHLRAAAPDRVQIWTVPGASHTNGLRTRPDEWVARVTEFLDRTIPVA